MKYGLGIDTGGTYTDGVIYDFESKAVTASAKTLTTKEELNNCIENILNLLPKELLSQVGLVSLSTTLATNACVEGRGARAAAVFIGCDRQTVEKYGDQYGLSSAEAVIYLDGGHNQNGDVIMEPDWDKLKDEILKHGQKAECFVITQMWGVRNPEFELRAMNIIIGLTGKPAIASHQLAGELNFLKRAATGLLNAQLIPLVNSFIDAVKETLARRNITCPLMIVRGDGSLMSEAFARERPVETLLSGPASSVSGGVQLSCKKGCIIVDIGGTTSDIAIIEDGVPRLSEEGVSVGNWILGTKAIKMHTAGLGGDSRIAFGGREGLTVGPVRVVPISWLANKYPYIIDELMNIDAKYRKHSRWLYEFFYLARDISPDNDFNNLEKAIARALSEGPLSTIALAEAVGSSIYELDTTKLERLGIIMRSGLTPTDIMHLTGHFNQWNREAVVICAQGLAFRLGISVNQLAPVIWDKIHKELYMLIARALLDYDDSSALTNPISPQAQQLLMMGHKNPSDPAARKRTAVSINLSTSLELVGIGAPAHIFLEGLAGSFSTSLTIPQYAPVANALGAITGNILVEETVTIKPGIAANGKSCYYCYSSRSRTTFESYEEACEWAKNEAAEIAEQSAYKRGAAQVTVTIDTEHNTYELPADYDGSEVPEPAMEPSAGMSANKGQTNIEQINKPKTDNEGVSVMFAADGKPMDSLPKNFKGNTVLLETIVTARAQGPASR